MKTLAQSTKNWTFLERVFMARSVSNPYQKLKSILSYPLKLPLRVQLGHHSFQVQENFKNMYKIAN